jgi:hypothetical protein
MEARADSVGLRALGLGAEVIDVLHREVKLVFVPGLPQYSLPRSLNSQGGSALFINSLISGCGDVPLFVEA